MPVSDKKRAYAQRLVDLVQNSSNILVAEADNVGSLQMQQIRQSLRGVATILMGKNTTIRKVLRDFIKENPGHPIENLVPYIQGNVGFIFTNEDPADVRETIMQNKAPAPARVGAVAPVDVYVEPGATGCDPGQTAWFQALNIPTKINRGQIEMIARVHLINQGDKVTESQAALLEKLNLKPFSYGLIVTQIYQDGDIFDAACLDVTEEDVQQKLATAAAVLAALGIEIAYPTKASLTHSINNAYKVLLGIGLETDYKFAAVKEFEDFMANAANFAPAAAGGAEQAAVEEEEESESSAGGAGDLFGDDDEDDW